ncbi:hypothetical protein [Amycolatopsis tucumanensis]|uniref:hypothetical protein n=1 Tax=Amycolatopsis tucumanensis TaxID=401106 RepID=UPI003D75C445
MGGRVADSEFHPRAREFHPCASAFRTAGAFTVTTRWGLDTRVILFVTLPTLPAEDADARERG